MGVCRVEEEYRVRGVPYPPEMMNVRFAIFIIVRAFLGKCYGIDLCRVFVVERLT